MLGKPSPLATISARFVFFVFGFFLFVSYLEMFCGKLHKKMEDGKLSLLLLVLLFP